MDQYKYSPPKAYATTMANTDRRSSKLKEFDSAMAKLGMNFEKYSENGAHGGGTESKTALDHFKYSPPKPYTTTTAISSTPKPCTSTMKSVSSGGIFKGIDLSDVGADGSGTIEEGFRSAAKKAKASNLFSDLNLSDCMRPSAQPIKLLKSGALLLSV